MNDLDNLDFQATITIGALVRGATRLAGLLAADKSPHYGIALRLYTALVGALSGLHPSTAQDLTNFMHAVAQQVAADELHAQDFPESDS